ncbi:ATP-binding protein [Roseimaritima sediminicola]|uniref:ATP-binding protein n=1 Tax=Roseimaritima sediminicola TaxID=2662066 RepID=UPI00129830F8|nr:ATP-binding protein [Roseimaritima sediminicola]
MNRRSQQDSLFDHGPSPAAASQEERPSPAGYRLDKLEVYNWGTFDKTVHAIHPRGESVLVVGENGAGKSTLVDAVLTLLVRPGVRNYNVAAGAGKKERDETSYIRGAYDKTSGEDDRARTQYLRPDNDFYTVILATFRCAPSGGVFTLAQVMHVAADKRVIHYAYAEQDFCITEHVAGFTSTKDIKRVLESIGWNVTDRYSTYHGWFRRKVRFQPKAMDVFNQTVAVKDVQKLNEFIRTHMLEKKPWNDKVEKLLRHFSQLSEAYQKLIEVREQAQLLQPIAELGDQYERLSEDLIRLRRQQETLPAYFDRATMDLLQPLCEQWSLQIDELQSQLDSLAELIQARYQALADIQRDIEDAGGNRIRDLQQQAVQHAEEAERKRSKRLQFEASLAAAGVPVELTSSHRFEAALQQVRQRVAELRTQSEAAEKQKLQHDIASAGIRSQLQQDVAELESLRKRRNNLPAHFVDVRDALCASLRLAPEDLPFAAEMMAVKVEHLEWEASIELVLGGFARTLLVPDDLYRDVSRYVDRNRLIDRHGKGMRLSYDRVQLATDGTRAKSRPFGLPEMLQFRPRHPLSPYVRGQIETRFDFAACEDIAQFQQVHGRAMTRNRHIKQDDRRHSKDDRSQRDDRRNYVLGWDNKAKIRILESSIRELEQRERTLVERSNRERQQMRQAEKFIVDLQRFCELPSFESIDDGQHDAEADRCLQEIRRLEGSNDKLLELKKRKAELEAEKKGLELDRQALSEHRAECAQHLKQGEQVLRNVLNNMETRELPPDEEALAELQAAWPVEVADIVALHARKDDAVRHWERLTAEAERRREPVSKQLASRMNHFLNRFPAFRADMDVSPGDDLPAYRVLKTKIDQDELPQHTRRFRQRLKSSVLQEIGVLNATLEQEREDIRGRIETLNEALRSLDWEPGKSYVRLEPKDSRDAEIRSFRSELHGCLDNIMDGSDEANERAFKRIEAFVEKLRSDENRRWRERVVDVRNWFNFVARVYDRKTHTAGAEYDGGSGKSGGEKGKLAFLVLVAAIAYQYELEPDGDNEGRFHFVMVDEMFSRSDDTRARAALELFERFGLQLAIVAPLDAKARIVEDHVGMYCHIVKDAESNRSRMLSLTATQFDQISEQPRSLT